MWRTMQTIKPGNLRVHRSTHQQKDVGLLRAGLPRIQGPRALVRHSRGSLTQITRSSVDQGDVGAAGPLVPSPQQQNGHLPAVPGSGGGPSKVPVQFVVPEYLTHWGQVLKVVGSLEELGNWKVEKAPSMQWNEGHTWTLDVQLPVGAVNFKIIMHDQPNSNVRWEMGDDRSVLIPETTTVTGAPVGQVGVTCNFNDVHNSRVEVRPDRAYLKQQLKAVEARVVAIQEKKRKLDQRMSVLTDGLKKYDATVALLQTGVQAAVEARRSSKESAAQQKMQQPAQQQQAPLQQPAEPVQQTAGSSNGVPVPDQQQQEQESVPAAFNPLGRRESIQVPIIDPSQLPSFEDSAPAAAAAADQLAAFSADSSVEDSTEELQGAAAALSPSSDTTNSSSDSSALIASYIPDVSAIKASHVNETVLSATVDQLLAAAEDALARSGGSSGPGEAPLLPTMSLGVSGVNDVQLAEEYVEELLAAASALEQQADRRASLLLEAAKHTGDSDMAADIEQLAAAELPPIPTVDELAAEAAASAIDSTLSFEEGSSSSMDTTDQGQLDAAAAAAPAFEDVSMAEQQQQQQPPEHLEQEQLVVEAAQPQHMQQQHEGKEGGAGPAPAARALDRDGSITFSAESLNVDVDVKQLLAAVLNRVGIPLTGQVTISATYTPNTPPTDGAASTTAAAAADKMESAAEASLDHNMDTIAAAVAAAGADDDTQALDTTAAAAAGPVQAEQQQQQLEALQQGQQQQNGQQQQQDRRPPLSPVDAIAAVFSRGSSMDSDDDSNSSSSSRSGGGSSSSRGFGVSQGSNGAKVPTQGNNRRYSRSAAVQAVAGSSYSSAAVATTGGEGRPPAVRLDAHEAALQLEAKEAARRAAAERVAAALAQVEEMRRSVVAANSLLKQQLHGSSDSGEQQSSSSSRAMAGAGTGNGSSSSVFSKYRVSYKGGRPAAAADSAADSSSSSSVRRQGSGGARSDPVSAPGASRGLPAIGATAVAAALQPVQGPAGAGVQQQQQPEVEGELKEELSLLAALAAEVAKQGRSRRRQ